MGDYDYDLEPHREFNCRVEKVTKAKMGVYALYFDPEKGTGLRKQIRLRTKHE